MKRLWIGLLLIVFVCSGCGRTPLEGPKEVVQGVIGDEMPINRALVAKMIALAFYTPEELMTLPKEIDFPDVAAEKWYYPYINGAVTLDFFSGDGEGFRPEDDLCLWEAQVLMDRLAPDYESRMVLTEDNREMPVAYSLWVQLLEKALMARRGEDSLYSYGFVPRTEVLFTAGEENLFDRSGYGGQGYDLEEYTDTALTFWQKGGEVVALLEVADTSPTINGIYCRNENDKVILLGGEGEKAYPNGGADFEEGFGQVTIAEGEANVLSAEKVVAPVIKRVDQNEIYLEEQGAVPWVADYRIYGQDFSLTEENKLIVGTDLADVYLLEGKALGAVVQKEVTPEEIRVLLGGGTQKKITLESAAGFTLSNRATQKAFAGGQKAVLTADLPWFDQGIVSASGDISLTFPGGETRDYHGKIELERRGEAIAVVHQLPLEEYLLGVVPYEMPVRFGQGALEAQAICARGYAYNQFFANSFGSLGAHVTDTTQSQVFMGRDTAPEAKKAVEDTAGQCLVAEGRVAQTYFYSASAGFGTREVDVWTADGEFRETGKSYLEGQNHGVSVAEPKTEAEWLAFWQDWSIDGYDKDAPWYRWKVYYGAGQMTEILQKTLEETRKINPALVRVKQGDGSFKEGALGQLGSLTGVQVIQRGQGGVIQILELTFTKGAVQVRTENAVRRVLSPTKVGGGEEIKLQRSSGGTLIGQKLLPSGYFAVKEMKNEKGLLTGIALYGGGCGHGVGMSQYGAKALGEQGLSGAEILGTYFPGTTVEQVMGEEVEKEEAEKEEAQSK